MTGRFGVSLGVSLLLPDDAKKDHREGRREGTADHYADAGSAGFDGRC